MLTDAQLQQYRTDGYVILDAVFTAEEVDAMESEFERLAAQDSPALIRESGSDTVRGHHGAHLVSGLYAKLIRDERLLRSAQQVLDSDVYVHQLKINAKRALVGEVWEWHQDFQFWRAEDGMPEPRAVNFGILLDDVTEFNGPLMVVPGSQNGGLAAVRERTGGDWQDTLAAQLRYEITPESLARATEGFEIVAPKGRRGSVLVFDCTILHASAPNMSAHDRRMAFVTYNSVENALEPVADARPEFVASRDFTPLESLGADASFARTR